VSRQVVVTTARHGRCQDSGQNNLFGTAVVITLPARMGTWLLPSAGLAGVD